MQNTGVNSIRWRIKETNDGSFEFKTLIIHPMETGQRRDKATGEKVPAHFIKLLRAHLDDILLIEMHLGENVSKNPYFRFEIMETMYNGQNFRVSWVDNNGMTIKHEAIVNFDENRAFNFKGHIEPDVYQ